MLPQDDQQTAASLTEQGLRSLIARPEQKLVGFPGFGGMLTGPAPDRVAVKLTVELGRTRLKLRTFEMLCYGDLLVLDQVVGGPMKIFVNGYHLGAGEVVTYGQQKYGVRLLSLVPLPPNH